MFGSDKSLGRPGVMSSCGGNDLRGEQTWRPEHKGMVAVSRDVRREIVLTATSGKPTQSRCGEGR
jgi:hypothetical protein